MYRIALIILLLVTSLQSYSQKLKFSLDLGYGSYKLEELKEMQENISRDPIETVTSFPSNIYYAAQIELLLGDNHVLGLSYNYYFTGGRNHVEDYSGEYKLDILVHANRLGVKYRYQLKPFDDLQLVISPGFQGGLLLSKMDINESMIIQNLEDSSNGYNYKYYSLFLEPLVQCSYPLGNSFSLDLKLAYEFDLDKELEKLYDDGQQRGVRCDWSGFRAQLGIAYYIDM